MELMRWELSDVRRNNGRLSYIREWRSFTTAADISSVRLASEEKMVKQKTGENGEKNVRGKIKDDGEAYACAPEDNFRIDYHIMRVFCMISLFTLSQLFAQIQLKH